jgi:predicted Zn finger-like uncharacterized protein
MKIQCPSCSDILNVDDNKIPDTGVYVNCKKCETEFLIKKSSDKCPICSHNRTENDVDCPNCGVIFKKYKEIRNIEKIQEEPKIEKMLKSEEILEEEKASKKESNTEEKPNTNPAQIILSFSQTINSGFKKYFNFSDNSWSDRIEKVIRNKYAIALIVLCAVVGIYAGIGSRKIDLIMVSLAVLMVTVFLFSIFRIISDYIILSVCFGWAYIFHVIQETGITKVITKELPATLNVIIFVIMIITPALICIPLLPYAIYFQRLTDIATYLIKSIGKDDKERMAAVKQMWKESKWKK